MLQLTLFPEPTSTNNDSYLDQCTKCSGTGIYRWAGVVENGVWRGKSGPCYECRGKGFVTPADKRRNAYYWDHAVLSAF